MSIFDGVELSDEVKATLQGNLDKHQEGFVSREEFNAVNGKKEELLTEAKNAKEKRRLAEEESSEASLAAAKSKGDIESITKSYEEKLRIANEQIDGFNGEIKQNSINSIAKSFVDDNVVSDTVVRNAITNDLAKRLDLRDGRPVVLDVEGNLTALSVDDLYNEFKTASVYKPHLVASKASGGSATGGTSEVAASGALADKPLADCKTKAERIAKYDAQLAGSRN